MTHYDSNYGNFQSDLYAQIRREAFGEDIGQNSWLTADELDRFLTRLELAPGKTLLDVACGAGGPALRVAEKTRCRVVGIDVHEQAISNARMLAGNRGLAAAVDFRLVDAGVALPFPDAAFDAITCIDAINHFPDRPRVVTEWSRLLKPGGRLLFTDPITLTGPLTNTEIAIRGSAGLYLFVPPGYDERIIADCGLRMLAREDATANMAEIADRRRASRASHEAALRQVEGDEAYERQQEYLTVAARIAADGRLSRILFVAEKSQSR